MDSVFVFNGNASTFPSAVFTDRQRATAWIAHHRLTGTPTEYPVDVGVYDWAVGNGDFTPKREDHQTPHFIGKFSSAAQWHAHFEDGATHGSEGSDA